MYEQMVFYAFAAVLLASAIMVISVRNPVHAALFLVLTFFTSAAVWLLLEAEFLAIVLVLVYVGAVMVLFLFVVMMLDINIARLREGFTRYLPIGMLIAVVMALEIGFVVGPKYFGAEHFGPLKRVDGQFSNTEALGNELYTTYVYPFEIASVILLVAIIAAIVLTMRKRKDNKSQNPSEQIKSRRAENVRIVKMSPERKP